MFSKLPGSHTKCSHAHFFGCAIRSSPLSSRLGQVIDQLLNSDEAQAARPERSDNGWEGRDSLGAIAAAIVQQNDRAVVRRTQHARNNRLAARQRPVARIDVPHDDREIELFRLSANVGVYCPVWRAEKGRKDMGE